MYLNFTYWLYKGLEVAIILVIGYVCGRLIHLAISKISRKFGLDTFFRKTSIGRALLRSGYTAGDFLGIFAKWVIYIIAILEALIALDYPPVSPYANYAINKLGEIVAGVIIIIIGIIFSDWLGDYIKRSYSSSEEVDRTFLTLAGDALKFILYYTVITIALKVMGIDVTILYIFANAIAWGIAIAIGVAMVIILITYLRTPIEKFIERLRKKVETTEKQTG